MSNRRNMRSRWPRGKPFSVTSLFVGQQAGWYRADRGVTGSPNITAVSDLSGQGWNLAVNVNSPQLVTDGGFPAIRMTGASAQEVRVVAPATCASTYTVAMVAKIDTAALASNRLFGVHRARGVAIGSNVGNYLLAHASAVNIATGAAVDTANYKAIIATGGNAITPKIWVNGVLQTNSPSGPQAYLNATSVGDFISIGYDAVSTRGFLREAIWIDRQISDAEASDLNKYLSSQWVVA